MPNEPVTPGQPQKSVPQREITEMVEKMIKADPRFTWLDEVNDEVHFEDEGGRFWSIQVRYRGSRDDR